MGWADPDVLLGMEVQMAWLGGHSTGPGQHGYPSSSAGTPRNTLCTGSYLPGLEGWLGLGDGTAKDIVLGALPEPGASLGAAPEPSLSPSCAGQEEWHSQMSPRELCTLQRALTQLAAQLSDTGSLALSCLLPEETPGNATRRRTLEF